MVRLELWWLKLIVESEREKEMMEGKKDENVEIS